MKGLSEAVSRIFTKFGVSVTSKPFKTIRNELVHPKEKVQYEEVSECIYQIPCKHCDKVYVGETGRNLGVRVGEHRKEVEAKDVSRFTRQSKKSAEEQIPQVSYHRSCDQRKSCDRLESGEGDRP